MTLEELKIGLVGLGYWGPNLLRVLSEMQGVDVKTICDVDASRLMTFARRHSSAETTTRIDDLLADPDLDAIVLATPVHTHFELAARSLEAGKHTFVDKPLGRSSEEAQRLVDLASRNDRVLMCGQTFLYSPPVRASKELIERGELGELYFISSSRVNLGIHQPDVSVVWDLGPHDFSILRYWLGERPSTVAAMTRGCLTPNTPDVAFIHLVFDSGTIANVEIAWLAPSKLRRTTIVGSEKMVVYDDTSNEPVRIFDSGAQLQNPQTFGEYQLTYRTGDIVSPKVEVTEPLALQLQDFCAAIREGTEPRSSAALGLDVVTIAEAVDRSLGLDGRPVDVESKQLQIGEDAGRRLAPSRTAAG